VKSANVAPRIAAELRYALSFAVWTGAAVLVVCGGADAGAWLHLPWGATFACVSLALSALGLAAAVAWLRADRRRDPARDRAVRSAPYAINLTLIAYNVVALAWMLPGAIAAHFASGLDAVAVTACVTLALTAMLGRTRALACRRKAAKA
jgi:hypothetical protein